MDRRLSYMQRVQHATLEMQHSGTVYQLRDWTLSAPAVWLIDAMNGSRRLEAEAFGPEWISLPKSMLWWPFGPTHSTVRR
jgi:hypothetical protein